MESLETVFNNLTDSQHSIEAASLWIMSHDENQDSVVETWRKCVATDAPPKKKLALLFLANDLIQKSRKKGSKLADSFRNPVVDCVVDLGQKNPQFKTKISRILQVWSDRRIYGAHVISGCLSSLDISLTTPSTPVPNALLPASTATSAPVTPTPTPPEKKSKKRPLSTPGPSDGPDLEIPSLLSDEHRRIFQMLGKAAKDGRAAAENRKKIGVIPSQFFSMETVNDLQSPDVIAAVDLLTQHTFALDQQAHIRRQIIPTLREAIVEQERLILSLANEAQESNRQLSALCNQHTVMQPRASPSSVTDDEPLMDLADDDAASVRSMRLASLAPSAPLSNAMMPPVPPTPPPHLTPHLMPHLAAANSVTNRSFGFPHAPSGYPSFPPRQQQQRFPLPMAPPPPPSMSPPYPSQSYLSVQPAPPQPPQPLPSQQLSHMPPPFSAMSLPLTSPVASRPALFPPAPPPPPSTSSGYAPPPAASPSPSPTSASRTEAAHLTSLKASINSLMGTFMTGPPAVSAGLRSGEEPRTSALPKKSSDEDDDDVWAVPLI